MYKSFLIFLLLFSVSAWSKTQIATFAGGCFWCMEAPFEKLIGVENVISGYAGGKISKPTYKMVSIGQTKHREAVQVHYDHSLTSYERLLEIFWMNINPTDKGGQFVDRGFQYSSAIFTHDKEQDKLAKQSVQFLLKSKKFSTIETPIITYTNFFPAEEYHQDYYRKSIVTKAKYKYYRNASGRDDFINKHWQTGDRFSWGESYKRLSLNQLKDKLTALEFQVTQKEGTEKPFTNQYWDNKKEGIYVDIVSGEALFSSKDKFKSGTGWPSFQRPIYANQIIEKKDDKLFQERIEVRSRLENSHLGHVFYDGPAPTKLRYCINSAALKFIPKEKMKKLGYGKYLERL